MHLSIESPRQPDVLQLIEDLDAYQKPLYPAESHHGIDIEALSHPSVIFVAIRDEANDAVGCGAVVVTEEYGELKRLYVRPEYRGRGLAKRLLTFLEAKGLERGCRAFALETGIYQPEAHRLYERAGYVRCEPFGDYQPDPMSVFMWKEVKSDK